MPVECVKFDAISNDFEREIFSTLCQQFQAAQEDYTVIGPSWVDGIDIDGLLITPNGILTIEAKNVGVRVEKISLNSPLRFYDQSGQEIDLSDRHREAFYQASVQWKKVRNLLSKCFDEADLSVFVKSLLVVPATSELKVCDELRNPQNIRAPAFILRLDEIPDFARQFSPNRVYLSRDVQNTIVTIIREGNGDSLTPEQKLHAVMTLGPTPSPKQYAQGAKTSTQVGGPAGKPSYPEQGKKPAPTQLPGPVPETSEHSGSRKWVWILLSAILAFGAYRLLRISLDPLPSVLFSVLLLAALLSRRWWAAVYATGAGIVYTVLAFATSLTGLLQLGAALLWPLTICGFIAYSLLGYEFRSADFDPSLPAIVVTEPGRIDGSPAPADELPDQVPAISDDGHTEEAREPASATPSPASSIPAEGTGVRRLRVIGNSNVRSRPDIASDIVDLALDGAEYTIIDISADLNWYLIELGNGNQGWIGSSRIELLSP